MRHERTLTLVLTLLVTATLAADDEIPIRVDDSREAEWIEILEPDLKQVVDEVVKAVQSIGEGDIDAAIAQIDKNLIEPPGGAEQRKQSLHVALAQLRQMPAARFESVDVVTVKSLSSRIRVLNLIAHGRFGPMLVKLGVDRYSNRWRVFLFNWTFDHNQIIAIEAAPENEGPILSYDLADAASVAVIE